MQYKKIFFRLLIFLTLLVFLISIGVWVYGRYFAHELYLDAEYNCRIDIHPSFNYINSEILRAIEIVKLSSPEYYKKLCSYVTAINTDYCDNPKALACARGGTKISFNKSVSDDYRYPKCNIEQKLAAALVHETCHFHQGHTATPESYRGDIDALIANREVECYSEQDQFVSVICK